MRKGKQREKKQNKKNPEKCEHLKKDLTKKVKKIRKK